MKKTNLFFTYFLAGTFASIAVSGCTEGQYIGEATVNACNADTTVYLTGHDESSPSCHIKLSFAYLNPFSDNDSVSEAVNYTLKQMFFGDFYAKLTPKTFIDSITASLISDYRRDVTEYYRTDIANGVNPEDMPSWYNYDFEITSELEKGRDSVWNFQVITFQNTGGAHPNTWTKWVNIDARTGHPVSREHVFGRADKDQIRRLLLGRIVEAANERLETDTITGIDGLRANGILLDEDVFIPENFLLTDDGIKFLYNPYEIAPYFMGSFELNMTNEEITPYLTTK